MNLKCDLLVSKFGLKWVNLCHYNEDQLLSYLLVTDGFDVTDYSGYTFYTARIPDAGNMCAPGANAIVSTIRKPTMTSTEVELASPEVGDFIVFSLFFATTQTRV